MAEATTKAGALTGALVARLIREARTGTSTVVDCEVVGLSSAGRCIEPAVAARFDGMFVDLVCAEHAERAKTRPRTQVVYATGAR